MTHLRPWALASSALVLLLAGCTVGPNYHRPTAATAPAWKENTVPPPDPPNGTWKQAEPSDATLRGQWWDLYGDPQLSALEAKVAVSNQTLRAAMEQYQSAREQVRIARSQYFPTFSAGPSDSHPAKAASAANIVSELANGTNRSFHRFFIDGSQRSDDSNGRNKIKMLRIKRAFHIFSQGMFR